MNKKRLSKLESIVSQLEDLRDELQEIQQEEQECYDNAPENLQSSERYEQMETNAYGLDNACDELDCVISEIRDIIGEN